MCAHLNLDTETYEFACGLVDGINSTDNPTSESGLVEQVREDIELAKEGKLTDEMLRYRVGRRLGWLTKCPEIRRSSQCTQ